MTLEEDSVRTRLTPTLATCLTAGIAAGIALARPADSEQVHSEPVQHAAGDPAPAAAALPGRSEPIEITNFAFDTVVVEAGSVVEVRNVDDVEHTVTADDGSFDTGTIAGKGAATFVAPSVPGTYTFFCAFHPSMTGELIVR